MKTINITPDAWDLYPNLFDMDIDQYVSYMHVIETLKSSVKKKCKIALRLSYIIITCVLALLIIGWWIWQYNGFKSYFVLTLTILVTVALFFTIGHYIVIRKKVNSVTEKINETEAFLEKSKEIH